MLGLVDEAGVEHVRIGVFLDQLIALLDQPFHPDALLPTRTDAELAADLLEPLDVLGGLFQMRAERLLELRIVCRFRQLGQRFDELLLGAVEILQLIDVKVFQCIELHSSHLRMNTVL